MTRSQLHPIAVSCVILTIPFFFSIETVQFQREAMAQEAQEWDLSLELETNLSAEAGEAIDVYTGEEDPCRGESAALLMEEGFCQEELAEYYPTVVKDDETEVTSILPGTSIFIQEAKVELSDSEVCLSPRLAKDYKVGPLSASDPKLWLDSGQSGVEQVSQEQGMSEAGLEEMHLQGLQKFLLALEATTERQIKNGEIELAE